MRIWYLNHYASTPDQPVTGAYYLMQALGQSGHEVHIFASGFNYYRRKELRLKGEWFTKRERYEDVHFQWLRTIPTKGGALSRLLNMLSYTLVAIGVGLCAREKPDVVMASCPHPFAGFAGWLLAKYHGAKFVYEIRDIWPESMTQAGIVSEKHPLIWLMFKLQYFLYRRAALMVSVLPKFDRYLQERSIAYRRFLWVPNSVSIERAHLPALQNEPSDHFTVMYLGGHSKYQGLDTILEAAALLISQSHIRFVLVGDGSEKARLMEKAKSLALTNVEFRDAVPRSDIMRVAAEADAFVLHFQAIPLLRYGISNNKLCDYMLAARPVIFAAEAANNSVEESKSGITVPPESPQAMADAIQKLASLPFTERQEMGARAQAYALEHFDVTRQAEKLTQELTAI